MMKKIIILGIMTIFLSTFIYSLGCSGESCILTGDVSSTNLIRHYVMNESSGSIHDNTNTAPADLGCGNAPDYGQADPFGGTSALHFTRTSNEYCEDTTERSDIGFAADFSYNIWVDLDTSFSTEQNVITAYSAANHEEYTMLGHPSHGGLMVMTSLSPSTWLRQKTGFQGEVSNWQMYTFTREGTTFTTYIDGVVNMTNTSTVSDLSAVKLVFASHRVHANSLNGDLSSASLWGRALGQAEITCLYDGSCAGGPPIPAPICTDLYKINQTSGVKVFNVDCNGRINATNEFKFTSSGDLNLYFNLELLQWDVSEDYLSWSGDYHVMGDITNTGGITSGGAVVGNQIIGISNIYSLGNLYTTGVNDDLWIGAGIQSDANFQAYATGKVYIDEDDVKIYVGEDQECSWYYTSGDVCTINPQESKSSYLHIPASVRIDEQLNVSIIQQGLAKIQLYSNGTIIFSG